MSRETGGTILDCGPHFVVNHRVCVIPNKNSPNWAISTTPEDIHFGYEKQGKCEKPTPILEIQALFTKSGVWQTVEKSDPSHYETVLIAIAPPQSVDCFA
jgi:hypothetical protein